MRTRWRFPAVGPARVEDPAPSVRYPVVRLEQSLLRHRLIGGSSRSWDSARLIHTFQVVNVSVRAKPWFSYVASKANVSDFPSRRDFAAMAATIRAVHKDFCTTRDFVAPVQPAVHKSWAELAAALFPLPPRKRKRGSKPHSRGRA